jgi:hypothetical protein
MSPADRIRLAESQVDADGAIAASKAQVQGSEIALERAERMLREAYLILSAQAQGQRLDDQQMGNVRDLYTLIMIDLRYQRNVALDRLDLMRAGTDPGPLPGTGI